MSNILLPLLGVICTGCISLYAYEDQHYRVVDGDTGQPIAGARVSVGYDKSYFVMNLPQWEPAITDQGGLATLSVAKPSAYDPLGGYYFFAPGYMEHQARPLRGTRFPEDVFVADENRRYFIVPLYKPPSARFTVIVPEGYVGSIAVDLKPSESVSASTPVPREIRLPVSDSGYVSIEAAPLLFRASPSAFRAVSSADNVEIPRRKLEFPGLRSFQWVTSRKHRHLFAVGNEVEHGRLEAMVYDITYDGPGSRTMRFNEQRFNELFESLASSMEERSSGKTLGDIRDHEFYFR